jgi:hypothetical protein
MTARTEAFLVLHSAQAMAGIPGSSRASTERRSPSAELSRSCLTKCQQPSTTTGRCNERGIPMRAVARRARTLASDAGTATAEYAIATMAAVGFAGLLVVIMRSDAVRSMLTDLVHRALTFAG